MNNRTTEVLSRMHQTIVSYLDLHIQGRRFKGKILIEINCNDGGIGSVHINVEHNIKQKKVDNVPVIDYNDR